LNGKAARYASGQLRRLAQRQIKALGRPRLPPRVPTDEQIRRFQEGAEYWRYEQGLVTAEQYDQYLDAMAEQLRQQGGR